jgi:tRNA/tmRNA/rRNA uracil-C5-methylase (TrmA/RlmC/RlmD family)
LHRTSAGRDFEIAAGGFWQVHPAALAAFTAALLAGLDPQPGETVLELYAGAGALTWPLADAVGPAGRVISVESSAGAVRDARHNLADLAWVETHRDRISPGRLPDAVDLVVVDPPRAGVPGDVMSALLGLGARAFGYVSCNPATLARDTRVALDAGWQLASLRAFDAFPMTHHVECVAVLINPAAEPRGTGTAR